MQIVSTGKAHRIYTSPICISNLLDPKVYSIVFNEREGFALVDSDNILITEKIYGIHEEKVNKVLNSFGLFDRNLGVILSGDKGIGKSLFAKRLSQRAIENNYPVIIVDQFLPGIGDFISSIKQECLILFDEFDKTFCNGSHRNEMSDPQTGLLTLFDGLAQGKKLFVVTCNNLTGLNEFLINRPGRFHYHFRFEYPTGEEVNDYLKDKIPESMYSEIPKVVNFSQKVRINYDCLRAIAFELALGNKFENAIRDLNIMNIQKETHICTVHFTDGTKSDSRETNLDLFSYEPELIEFTWSGLDFYTEFTPSEIAYNPSLGISSAEGKIIDFEESYNNHNGKEPLFQELRQKEIAYISFRRKLAPNLHYSL